MNLTWHLVRTNLRHTALPLGGWLGFLGLTVAIFSSQRMPSDAVPAHELRRWIEGMNLQSWWAVSMQALMTVLLAGQSVLSDPLVGTDAFWATRPIAPWRLLVAKMLAIALGFVVAPMLILLPAWLTNGLALGELVGRAVEFAAGQGVLVLVAVALAAVAGSLAQFILLGLGSFVSIAIVSAWLLSADSRVQLRLPLDRLSLPLAAGFTIGLLAVAVVSRFAARHRAYGAVALVLSLGSMVLTLRAAKNTTPLEPALTVREKVVLGRIEPAAVAGGPLGVKVRAPSGSSANDFLLPVGGEFSLAASPGSRIEGSLVQGARWGEAAARQVAGLGRPENVFDWWFEVKPAGAVDPAALVARPIDEGRLEFRRARAQVLAELPVDPKHGGGEKPRGLRIVGIGEGASYERPSLIVEERESAALSSGPIGRLLTADGESRQDCYLLVHRERGLVEPLRLIELGQARLHGIEIRLRQLEWCGSGPEAAVESSRLPGWVREATLIKVQFTGAGRRVSLLSAADEGRR